jgi:hypothetical protein
MTSFTTGDLVWVLAADLLERFDCLNADWVGSRTTRDQKCLGVISESPSTDAYIWTVLINGNHETHHEIYIRKVNANG